MSNIICVISGFRSGVNEISAFFGLLHDVDSGQPIGPTFKGPETSIATNQRHLKIPDSEDLKYNFPILHIREYKSQARFTASPTYPLNY